MPSLNVFKNTIVAFTITLCGLGHPVLANELDKNKEAGTLPLEQIETFTEVLLFVINIYPDYKYS